MLAADLDAVAWRPPVAPDGTLWSVSAEASFSFPELTASALSVMPLGGVRLALIAVENEPTSIDSVESTSDGALITELAVVLTPALWATIGFALSTPRYAAIVPMVATDAENDQV